MSTRRFLDRLFGDCDGGVVELRALPSTRRAWAGLWAWSELGPFVTAEVNARQELYIGVATRRDTTNGTTANLHELPAVFCDFDRLPDEVTARLAPFPFPPSLVVHSGLGVHTYWQLREPLLVHEPAAIMRSASLLRRLSTYLGADEKSSDPARVLRLPGTFNYKYDAPRPVVLVHESDATVNIAELEDFLPQEVVRHNRVVLESTITPGQRNAVLYNLTRTLRYKGLPVPIIVSTVEDVNAKQCDPPLEAEEVTKLLRHALAQPDRPSFTPPSSEPTVIHDAEPEPTTVGGVFVNLATVEPEAIDWIWPAWLARRKAVALAGDPGKGKSFLIFDIAARISRGSAWPTGGNAPQGRSLFLCAEDGLADTVRPRIDAAGGDASQIDVLTSVRDGHGDRVVNLATDLKVLEDGLQRFQPVLVTIDPINAYPGIVDSYKDSDVRKVLAPLIALIDRYRCALVWVAHLSKASERKALYRHGGSIGFVGAARLALIVGDHPDDPAWRVIAHLKNNLAPDGTSLTYQIADGRVVWGEPVRFGADDILEPTSLQDVEDGGAAVELIATLREEHPDGLIDTRDANARAELLGIPRRTLQYAARKTGLKPLCTGRGSTRRSFWYDPTIRTGVEIHDAE